MLCCVVAVDVYSRRRARDFTARCSGAGRCRQRSMVATLVGCFEASGHRLEMSSVRDVAVVATGVEKILGKLPVSERV